MITKSSWNFRLSIYLFLCLYIPCLYMMKDAWIVLSTCLSIHASIYTLSIHDERRLNCPVYLVSIHVSIYTLSVHDESVYIYLIYTWWKTPGFSCLPVYLFMCLYIPCLYMMKDTWIFLSTCLSIHVSIYTLSIYMMKDAWIFLSTCLSFHVSIYTLSIHDERRLDCPGWSRTTIVVLNWFSLYSSFH